MNRLEWVLGIILVVLLGVVGMLAYRLYFRAPNSAGTAAGDEQSVVDQRVGPTAVFAGQTAQTAYKVAQPTAVGWQADAQLVKATATWPQGADETMLLTGETTWGFTFFSALAKATAVVTVVENSPQLVSQAPYQPANSPALAGPESWQVDSTAVIKRFMTAAGSQFLRDEGNVTLTAVLLTDGANGRWQWLVTLFAAANGRTLAQRFDAQTGELVQAESGK